MKRITFLFIILMVIGCGKERSDIHATYTNTTRLENVEEAQGEQVKLLEEVLTSLRALEGCCSQNADDIDALQDVIGDLQQSPTNDSVAPINSSLSLLADRVTELEYNLGSLKKNGDNLILEGCNLVVRDAKDGPIREGLGNIVVGRDDIDSYTTFYQSPPLRTGSNNIVVGGSNEYTGNGGLVCGALNRLLGDMSVVFSCENSAEGQFSTVTGGTNNKAHEQFSSVSGGIGRSARGMFLWRAGELRRQR